MHSLHRSSPFYSSNYMNDEYDFDDENDIEDDRDRDVDESDEGDYDLLRMLSVCL